MRRAVAAAAFVGLLAAAPAVAEGGRVVYSSAVSGATPFPNGCGLPPGPDGSAQEPEESSEAEPAIAVNPTDENNVVAYYQQDRFKVDGGAITNVVAASHDVGRTWKQINPPGLSVCTGGRRQRTSDPWVSIGPDGRTYIATLTFDETPASLLGAAGPTQISASTSTASGEAFGPPVQVVDDGLYDDREAVTADPARPGTAYMTWVRRLGALGETGVEYFSKTTDGGRSWSPGRVIYAGLPATLPDPTLTNVLPDGTIVNAFLEINGTPFVPGGPPRIPFTVKASYSADGGQTFSIPVSIAQVSPNLPIDPDTGREVRSLPVVSIDSAPDGTVYIAWNEIPRIAGPGDRVPSTIRFSKSIDGGRTWRDPRVAATSSAEAFLPSLAVAGDGTVGITFVDYRNDKRADNALTADNWFVHSHDGGATWEESRVAGPYDMLSAPATGSTAVAGRFVGDYQGMDGLANGFAAIIAQAKPQSVDGPTGIFFARVAYARPATGSGTRLWVAVKPRSVPSDTAERFRFTVRSGGRRGARVKGATVRFRGRSGKTDRRGRATISRRIRHAGRYRAYAYLRGARRGRAAIRVR